MASMPTTQFRSANQSEDAGVVPHMNQRVWIHP